MPTRLSLWCDRLIEAGWLATVLIIPLFFQTSTARVFEPDKMALVRSIALVMTLAWAIRAIAGRLAGRASARPATPGLRLKIDLPGVLLWPTLLLIVANIVAALGSIAPRMSLLGSYQRGQGLYSFLALALIGLLAMSALRRRDQIERLVTTAVLASIPAALFAVLQGVGAAPGVWSGLYGGRVFGTVGNPIFLAGYLLMIIPLTLARLAAPQPGLLSKGPETTTDLRVVYGLALGLQVVAFVMTLSRGPWLGLAAGALFLALALATAQGQRRLALGVASLALLLALLAGALNLPPVRASLAGAPAPIVRLTELIDLRRGSTGEVRLLLWDASARVMSIDPLRLPIGYGPETNLVTLTANASPELRYMEQSDRNPDRAHNESFDRLIETGLLGLVGYLWLIGAMIYAILRAMGLAGSATETRWYAGLTAGLTLLGGLTPAVLGAPALSGLGLALGLLGGVWLYLMIEALNGRGHRTADKAGQWLLAGLLAVVTGHLVEVSLGPMNAVNRVYFWVFVGLVGAVAARPALLRDERLEARETGPAKARVTGTGFLATSPAAYGWLGALLLATLTYSFVPLDGFALSAGGYAIVPFLGLTVLLSSALLWLQARREAALAGTQALNLWLIPALTLAGVATQLVLRGLTSAAGGDAVSMMLFYFALLLSGLALLATSLPRPAVTPAAGNPAAVGVYIPLALGGLALLLFTNFVPLQADTYLRTADAYAEAGDYQQALELATRAAQSQLDEPAYSQKLTEYLSSVAAVSPSPQQRDTGFEQAVALAELAATKLPVHADYRYNVGHAYLLWAQATQDTTRRNQILTRAAQNFQHATQINPNSVDSYTEWGMASMLANQPPDQSQALLLKALELDPRNAQAYLYLGRLYQSQNQAEAAEQAYLRTLELDPTLQQAVTAYSALGDLYQRANRVADAIHVTQRVAELVPDNWVTHLNLALLYQRGGRGPDAQAEAQLAYNLAPPEAKQRVVDVIAQLPR